MRYLAAVAGAGSYDTLCRTPAGAAAGSVPTGLTIKEYSELKSELSQALSQKKLSMSDLVGKVSNFKSLLTPEAQCLFEKDSTFMVLLCGGSSNCDVGEVLATLTEASSSGPLAALDDITGFALALSDGLQRTNWDNITNTTALGVDWIGIFAKALNQHPLKNLLGASLSDTIAARLLPALGRMLPASNPLAGSSEGEAVKILDMIVAFKDVVLSTTTLDKTALEVVNSDMMAQMRTFLAVSNDCELQQQCNDMKSMNPAYDCGTLNPCDAAASRDAMILMFDSFFRSIVAPIADKMGASKEMNNILTSNFLPDLKTFLKDQGSAFSMVKAAQFAETQFRNVFTPNMKGVDKIVLDLMGGGATGTMFSSIMQYVETATSNSSGPAKTGKDHIEFVFTQVLANNIAPVFPATPPANELKIRKLLSSPHLKAAALKIDDIVTAEAKMEGGLKPGAAFVRWIDENLIPLLLDCVPDLGSFTMNLIPDAELRAFLGSKVLTTDVVPFLNQTEEQ